MILGELRSLLDDIVFFLRSKEAFGSIIYSGSRVTTSGSIFGGSNMVQ